MDSKFELLVRLLVQHGASPFVKDKVSAIQRGKKSMDLAQSPEMKQLLFLSTSRRTKSSGSPIFNVTAEPLESIPPISLQTFEKLSLSPSSSSSEIQTTSSQGKRACNLREEPDEEHAQVPSPALRTFSFGRGAERKSALQAWLTLYSLESLADALVESGYDDVEQMASQMRTHMPITKQRLIEVGISRPGHAVRLLAALELETKALRPRKGDKHRCCGSPRSGPTLRSFPSLAQWLNHLDLGVLYPRFVEAGYEDLEPLLAVMKSSYCLSELDLQVDIHIDKPGHRHRVLSKLVEDCKDFDPLQRPYGSLRSTLSVPQPDPEDRPSCDLCNAM